MEHDSTIKRIQTCARAIKPIKLTRKELDTVINRLRFKMAADRKGIRNKYVKYA